MSRKIVLAGGSGLVGRRLADLLRQAGYQVNTLTRQPARPDEFHWDPASGILDPQAMEGAFAVINLAGAGIADQPWTAARKKELIDSRVQSTQLLIQAMDRMAQRPQVYLNASAIGYYGNSGERRMTESDAPVDQSFMVDCCRQWEQAVAPVSNLGIRTVVLRIGIVLSTKGGALAEVLKPLRFGLATYFADGRAWWSWIHLDDLCRMIQWTLESPEVAGTYNAVAPQPVRGKELVTLAKKVWKKFAIMVPAPAQALRLLLGEMSAVVLNSNLVSAEKVLKTGFKFQYPDLESALRALAA